MTTREQIRAQPGPQTTFLSTPADFAVYGGSAGSGKSFALLLEPTRHIHVPGFSCVTFRRTYPEITNAGGLWDDSQGIYREIGGYPKRGLLEWVFKPRARIVFSHMQHEDDRFLWKGSQVPLVNFDQIEDFTWRQVSYMFSRNRSMCGVRPYMRGTANPDPDSWLRKFMAWWIDPDTGLPILERSGVLRWYLVLANEVHWGDSRAELIERYGDPALSPDDPKQVKPKSFTFVPGTIYDNKKLLEADPGYLANLQALPLVDRERLLGGNWNVRDTAGKILKRDWFEVVEAAPRLTRVVRGWDRAATDASEPNAGTASWTAGCKMGRADNGIFYIVDMRREQMSGHKVEEMMRNVASADGHDTIIGIFQDPGAPGKNEARDTIGQLAGYNVYKLPTAPPRRVRAAGDPHEQGISGNAKVVYAKPWARQAEAGNVKLVRGSWNEAFLNEAENFDGSGICDQIDATSNAFNLLTNVEQAGVF